MLPALVQQSPAPDPDLALARAVTAACYGDHLKRQPAFDLRAVRAKRRWFTAGLLAALHKELQRPADPGEAPFINGDPFTNAQEPVASRRVGEARRVGDGVEVPVFLKGDGFVREVRALLRREAAGWRIDDLRYEDGGTLRGLLDGPR